MAKRFGVVGCGYVGTAVAVHLRQQGYELIGTTTGSSRLAELCDLVDHPRILCAGDPGADFSVLDDLDGLLIAMAPTTASYEEDQYRAVYGEAVPALVEAPASVLAATTAHQLSQQCRRLRRSIRHHHHGIVSTDLSNTTNALLVQAETAVLGLNNPLIQTCVLRLEGIYGPARTFPPSFAVPRGSRYPRTATTSMPGCTWMTLFVGGLCPAAKTAGIYNLVDDLQLTRRELSNALCDDEDCPR